MSHQQLLRWRCSGIQCLLLVVYVAFSLVISFLLGRMCSDSIQDTTVAHLRVLVDPPTEVALHLRGNPDYHHKLLLMPRETRRRALDKVPENSNYPKRPSRTPSIYLEALVHPVLLAHKKPQEICILAPTLAKGLVILQQVWKHKGIETVTVVVKTEGEEHTQTMTLDDVHIQGKIHRVKSIGRWLEEKAKMGRSYDVVLLDTGIGSAMADHNDNKLTFAKSLQRVLYKTHGGGALAMRLDTNPATQSNLMEALVTAGFKGLQLYEEGHGPSSSIQHYVIAYQSSKRNERWLSKSQAELDLILPSRLRFTKEGRPPLRHVDASTLHTYHFPSRPVQDAFCNHQQKKNNGTVGCRREDFYDPNRQNMPASAFDVRQSTIPNGGRGLFAKQVIPQGSYIGANECSRDIGVPGSAYHLASRLRNLYPAWRMLYTLYEGFGTPDAEGDGPVNILPAKFVFVNHGCNGTSNFGVVGNDITELTANTMEPVYPTHLSTGVYNPAVDRRSDSMYCALDVAKRDILEGEELLQNYVEFAPSNNVDEWADEINNLRRECKGQKGVITSYDERSNIGMSHWPRKTISKTKKLPLSRGDRSRFIEVRKWYESKKK